jgi:hypothetical protein
MAALAGLIYGIVDHPPSGVPWTVLWQEPAPVWRKLHFLLGTYVWPGVLSFLSITLFQLQSRVSGTGANKRTVFGLCTLASAAMLEGLRALSFSSVAGPSYVAGMALGYTVMSRLYAVRLRTFFNGVRVPWPVWRGNPCAMAEMEQRMAQMRIPPK